MFTQKIIKVGSTNYRLTKLPVMEQVHIMMREATREEAKQKGLFDESSWDKTFFACMAMVERQQGPEGLWAKISDGSQMLYDDISSMDLLELLRMVMEHSLNSPLEQKEPRIG